MQTIAQRPALGARFGHHARPTPVLPCVSKRTLRVAAALGTAAGAWKQQQQQQQQQVPVACELQEPSCSEALARAEQPRSWLATFAASLTRAAVLAGLILAVSLTTAGHALAARTGGRAGGSSFGGGGGFGRSSGFSRSTSSGFGGSTSAGFGGTSSSGFGSAAPRSTTHTVVHHRPSLGFGWGMPSLFLPAVPFGGYGHGYGSQSSGGSLIMTVLLFAVVAMIAVSAFKMLRGSQRRSSADSYDGDEDAPITVAKLQVGLLASADNIKSDLNLLAASADTSTRSGLQLLLQETVIALLRNPAYCAYAASSSRLVPGPEDAERLFNSISMEERSKVDAETLVNIKGARRNKTISISPGAPAELVVVNLMVAVQGDLQLPTVRNQQDLQLAMSKLGSIAAQDVMAVEVFWTPQAEGDVLTQTECLTKYPNLVLL